MRALLLVGFLVISACGGSGASAVDVTSQPVPSLAGKPASFDVVEIDQTAHRLYAADRTDQGIDVFDTASRRASYLKTIALPAAPNGVAVAPDLARVFVGMSDGSLAVIDTRPATPTVNEVATGGKSVDLIDYAPSRQEVFASNGIEGTLAAIDARTGLVKGRFLVGYALEQPRFNAHDGMVYVTSPDADSIFRLDPTTGAIKDRIKLGGCQPHGLAIDPKSNEALVACRSDVRRWNLANITDAQVFGDVTGGDVVSYDALIDRFFVAVPQGPRSGVGVFGGRPIAYIATVVTVGGGNSAAYDEKTGVVYAPDVRSGKAGVAGFMLPSAEPDLVVSFQSLGMVGVLLAVVILVMYFIGKGGDPVNRLVPVSRRRRA